MRTIFLLLFISLFMVDLSAQTNYYRQDKTFYEEGYTYQCDVTEGAGLVKGKELIITMYIDPDTGKIADVEFIFTNFNPYATIPISVYRKIEVEIKKNIWFNITPDGKRFNYIMLWWGQEPK